MDDFTDVTYEVDHGLAWITINRPDRYNSFRARTVDELVMAFKKAWGSDEVGVIALTGTGEKAFCTGGDQKQRMETGDYGPSESGLFEIESLHRLAHGRSTGAAFCHHRHGDGGLYGSRQWEGRRCFRRDRR